MTMLKLPKHRGQIVIFVVAIFVLNIAAKICRELVGEKIASKTGKFTFMDCLNSGTESLACGMKVAIKLHVYNIRIAHVEKVRQDAMNTALAEALSKGLTTTIATKQAHKIGAKAAKLANRQANRILGPIIASGWDFFEAMYYGGDIIEAFLRGIATLFGTYLVGYHGQKALGRIGYLLGSQLGNWVGGRVGLLVYDIVEGVSSLFLSKR